MIRIYGEKGSAHAKQSPGLKDPEDESIFEKKMGEKEKMLVTVFFPLPYCFRAFSRAKPTISATINLSSACPLNFEVFNNLPFGKDLKTEMS